MSIVTINDKHLTDIATAIRQKSGIEDTFKPSEMAKAIKDISGGNPILEDIIVNPSISEQTIIPSADYDGINQVKVNAVTSNIDTDIKPENIKKGVEILGVVGTIEDKPAEPILQNKTVNPSTGKQIITADSGYDGLGNVTINEVTSSIDSNIKADNIKQGVSILGVQGTLEQGAEVVKKYKPQQIRFENYQGTNLLEETKNLDTSLLVTMYKMFCTNNNLVDFDISQWDMSNIRSVASMFENCNNIKSVDLSNHNCNSITDTNKMFYNCNKLTNVDLSSFTGEKITDISQWFSYCTVLEKIDIRNMTFDKVQYSTQAFYNVPTNCLIIVKDDTAKTKVLTINKSLANVKTLAEYQAEGGV